MGEHQRQKSGVRGLPGVCMAVHEDSVVRNKNIVKDGQGFHIADMRDRRIDIVSLVSYARKSRQFDPLPVRGDRKGYRVVLIGGPHEAGGRHDDLIHIGSRKVTGFGPSDNDSVRSRFHNAQVHIRVRLFGGSFHSVALHIRLGAVSDDIVLLTPCQIL